MIFLMRTTAPLDGPDELLVGEALNESDLIHMARILLEVHEVIDLTKLPGYVVVRAKVEP